MLTEEVRNRLVRVNFDGYVCYVDLQTLDVYSARLKLLRCYWNKQDKMLYYNILYNGKRCKRSQHRLLELARGFGGKN